MARTLRQFFFVLILSGIGLPLLGDTLILKNETVLVGKVKGKYEDRIIFKNSYGAFNVSRDQIKKLYETKSYKEDITIRKKLGLNFNALDIRKNYSEGDKSLTPSEVKKLKAGTETRKTEKETTRRNRIQIEPVFTKTMGELGSSIPYGYGALLSYSRDFESLPFFNIYLRGGYIYHNNAPYKLGIATTLGGPGFSAPVKGSLNHWITGSVTAGASYMNISNETDKADTISFTTFSHLGYEYRMNRTGFFINICHLYVYDKDVFFHSAGLSAGLIIKF